MLKTNSDAQLLIAERIKPIMRAPEVCSAFGIGRSTLYHMVARGEFPKPVKLGSHPRSRLSGWFGSDLEAWLSSKRAA